MTHFEHKAIEWLQSKYQLRDHNDESYYASLLLNMLDGLGEQSVSDLLDNINELEGRIEYLEDIIDAAGLEY